MKPYHLSLLVLGSVLSGFAAVNLPESKVAFETRRITDTFFCEGASAGDFNRDGKNDIVSGPYWYEGPEFEKRHEIYPAQPYDPNGYSENFLCFTGDVDKDGWTDVVVFGFPGKEVLWYANPKGEERHWDRHVAIPVGDNESPHYADLTGDGEPEVVCSSNGVFGYASPGDDPTKEWEFIAISEPGVTGGRFTHGLGIGDVNGDGKPDLLDKDSWWENPGTEDGKPLWKRHRFQFAGPGGAQMYAYDFDGDGDNDILTSIHAHAWGLAWFEQTTGEDGNNTFVRHMILNEKPEENPFGIAFSQMHAIELVDVDRDGIKDIVTGKRWWAHNGNDPGANMPAVLYWFRTVPGKESGKADFLPYQIHNDSGVGTQFATAELTGDDKVDIVVGNKKGTFVHLQR